MDKYGNGNITKWFTESINVDIDTGEIISLSKIKNKEYRIINKTKTYEIKEHYGVRRYTNECRKHEQTKLEF